jgi:hypothetical protein
MRAKPTERGQALVIIALAVVGLFGFSALAIDGSRVFSDRRNAQNAADTASLAAALTIIRGTGDEFKDAAIDRAASNGYVTDADSVVEVHLCNDPTISTPCEGLPSSASPENYVQVKITSTIPATIARIIGRQQFTNIVTAVAYAGPEDPRPFANGAALAALAPNEPDAIFGNGNVFLDINNSGIFSNSNVTDTQPPCQNGSMSVGGNGSYTVDTSVQVVGSLCQGNNTTINGPVEAAGPMPYPPTIDVLMPNIVCSGSGGSTYNAVTNTTTYSPGNYTNLNVVSTGEVIFSPGNYCFQGGASFLGPDIIANDVNFLIPSGEFRTAGNSSFTCNDVLFHVDGGTGVHFNGNGGNYCNAVTFIASTGDVTWNGNVTNRLYAPTGGVYEGLLIYLPYGNSSPLSITGNAGNELTGSIIAVSSEITVGGNNWTNGLNSQIVGYTIDILGNSNTVINYNPDDQFIPPLPSAVQLTK